MNRKTNLRPVLGRSPSSRPPSKRQSKRPPRIRLPRFKPYAFRLLLVGHILILLALCDFAARLHAGVSIEPRLYIGEFMRSVAVAFVLLWAAGLGLDFWERKDM